MNVTKLTDAKMLLIDGAFGLDPVTVIVQDFAPGVGKIIIECYGKAWANCWCAMGNSKMIEFFLACDNDYLIGKLNPIPRRARTENSYLGRIVSAVKEGLEELKP